MKNIGNVVFQYFCEIFNAIAEVFCETIRVILNVIFAYPLEIHLNFIRDKATHGDREAKFHLGNLYYHGKGVMRNKQQALLLYREAAKIGHKIVQYNLGIMYQNGEGLNINIEKAVYWFSKSAENGFSPARNILSAKYPTLTKTHKPEKAK